MELGVARVLALGREGEEEVATAAQSRLLEDPPHQLVGRARVGGRLEHHELAGPQTSPDLLGRVHDVAHVGLALRGQRRRHADDQCVGLGESAEIGGGLETPLRRRRGRDARRRGAGCSCGRRERLDLGDVDVEAEDAEALLGERQRQGQPDVAEADDADHRGLVVEPLLQYPGRAKSARSPVSAPSPGVAAVRASPPSVYTPT